MELPDGSLVSQVYENNCYVSIKSRQGSFPKNNDLVEQILPSVLAFLVILDMERSFTDISGCGFQIIQPAALKVD